jgi:hypothetical protein
MSGDLAADGVTCKCDPGFMGPTCCALDFAPPPRADAGLNPVFPGIPHPAQQWTWGGSPMRDADGLYHLFFSWFVFAAETPPTILDWFNSSVVAHATSDSPVDNYVFDGTVVLPLLRRDHNPQPYRDVATRRQLRVILHRPQLR